MKVINDTIENFYLNKADQRAIENRPGFRSKQSFNFAAHHISGRDGYGSLRVFNDDFVDHGVRIPIHPHANFEILSVILTGEMEHEDNLGNQITVETNEVKLMSSGSGLQHGGTCYNHTNFLQIWIIPNQRNTPPKVSTQKFSEVERLNKWQLQVSPDPIDKVLTIKQNMRVYRAVFDAGMAVDFEASGKQKIFLMPLSGSFELNNQVINERDSVEFTSENGFSFQTNSKCDIWVMCESI